MDGAGLAGRGGDGVCNLAVQHILMNWREQACDTARYELIDYLEQSRHRGKALLGQADRTRFRFGSARPHNSVLAFLTPCRTLFARLEDSPALGSSGSSMGAVTPAMSSETTTTRESSPRRRIIGIHALGRGRRRLRARRDRVVGGDAWGRNFGKHFVESRVGRRVLSEPTRASAVGNEHPKPDGQKDLVQVAEGTRELVTGVGT